MRELLDIVAAFDSLCREGKPAALATVIAVTGSSYRRPGARMLIAEDGRTWGGVSGGCLERDVITRSRGILASGLATTCKYDSADDEQLATGVATGCGGTVEVLIQPLTVDRPGPMHYLSRLIADREPICLATLVQSKDRAAIGQVRCGVGGWPTELGDWFIETLRPPQRLVIFGTGPDVVPLLEIATTLGWSVAVVGKRPTAEATVPVPLHPTDAVLVMTHNIARDRLILQSLRLQPRYLGLLGPRHRLDQIIDQLPPAVRETVVSPVGLDLGAETPQEIALAIMAEIQANLRHASAERLSEKTGPIHDRPADAESARRTLRAIVCPT